MMRKFWSSYGAKKVLRWTTLFILTGFGLLLINFVWLFPTIGVIRRSASVFALAIAERASSDIVSYLDRALESLGGAAEDIALNADEKEMILIKLLKRNAALKSVALINDVGKEIFRLDRFRLTVEGDLRDHSSRAGLSKVFAGEVLMSTVYFSTEGEPLMEFMVPIRTVGGIKELILAELNLRNLISTVSTSKLGSGHIYVLDQEGFQILHHDIVEILRRSNLGYRSIAKKVLGEGKIADGLAEGDSYINSAGEDVFAVGVPIVLTGWGLFVEQPKSRALADEDRAIIFAFVAISLGVFIFLVIMTGNVRLENLNNEMRNLLRENYVSAKMLVQRDRELVFTNVTLRRLNEEFNEVAKMLVRRDLELTEANARLQELDMIKSEFVSVAAHQLRTPLTGIRWSYAALLEGGVGLKPDQRKLAEDGLKVTLRAIGIVDGLLNVARIEEGRFGFNFKQQKVEPMLKEVVSRIEKRAQDKGISFSLAKPKKSFPSVNMDEEKMMIALENLLDNAIAYTSPGGKISLRVWMENSKVWFEVKDTGIGIPRNQFHRVFSKFFRGDNAILTQTFGSGLGLYMVKNIVEKHNGSINFESEEGRGTTFIFSLPVVS